MRAKLLGLTALSICLSATAVIAGTDVLKDAIAAIDKGDLRTARIDLRNAVRNDPQRAEAHFLLARVDLELGDPAAAEREAVAARDRGYDPRLAEPLLAQVLLRQGKFNELLKVLQPDGKDPQLDASILVSRGYAALALKRADDAKAAFAQAQILAPNAPGPLVADARLALAQSDIKEATAKIDRAIALQPDAQEALLTKAQILRAQKDNAGALATLDQLIADHPGNMQARLERASIEISAGRFAAGRADVDTVLKVTPGSVAAIYLGAVLDAQAHNYKAADANLQRIGSFLDRFPNAYYVQALAKQQLGELEQAEDAVQRHLARAPDDAAGYRLLAQIQSAKHHPDQAVATLSKLAAHGKPDAQTFDMLGKAYSASGQGQEAVAAFRKAEALAPDDIGVQTRLASARFGIGDTDAAIGGLEHTLQLAPQLPAISQELFFAALSTGDMDKAQDALRQIRAVQGDNEIVGNLAGLLKLAQLDFSGSRQTFSKLIQAYPDFVPARVNLARLDSMLGDTATADTLLNDIVSRQPAAQPALTMLVASYLQTDRLGDAITLLQRAHAIDPADSQLTVALGGLYVRAGKPQAALDLTATAGSTETTGVDLLGLRAAAHVALGQKSEARADYQQILKQRPDLLRVRQQLVALLLDAGDYESARNVISAGFAATPGSSPLYRDYVLVDFKAAGLDAALATADRLQNENSGLPAARALKADAYLAANRPNDAIASLTKAYDEAPSSFLASQLAAAMLRAGQLDRANALLTRWLATHPDDAAILQQASTIQITSGHYAEAATLLEQSLKLQPNQPVTLNNLAWVDQQLGRTDAARTLARQAYVLSPGAQTADTLGWILTTAGDAQHAVPLLRQASLDDAGDPRIRYHFAVALKAQGDSGAARQQLERVVATSSNFSEKTDARRLLDQISKGS